MTNHHNQQDHQSTVEPLPAGTDSEPAGDTPVAEMTNHRRGWDETEIPSQGIIRAVSNVDPQPVSDDDIAAMVVEAHTALQDPGRGKSGDKTSPVFSCIVGRSIPSQHKKWPKDYDRRPLP